MARPLSSQCTFFHCGIHRVLRTEGHLLLCLRMAEEKAHAHARFRVDDRRNHIKRGFLFDQVQLYGAF